MVEETGDLVHDVFRRGLDLKDRLKRGEAAPFATEQAEFLRRLAARRDRRTDLGDAIDRETAARADAIRYVLACWLDETFILHSAWDVLWNEHKIEVALFGTNDRAWRFWDLARRALVDSESDLLEACFLAVMLGFRGELREQQDVLETWATAARAQVETARPWESPPELVPPTYVPPLRGKAVFQTMLFRAGMVVLALVPFLSFLLMQIGR